MYNQQRRSKMKNLTLIAQTNNVSILVRGTGTTVINCRGVNLDDRKTFLRTCVEIKKHTGANMESVKVLVNKLRTQADQIWEGIAK